MPLNLILQWTATLEGVEGLSEMPIPRYLEYKGPRSLHVFCDASKEAYGACVYVVTKEASHLVFAKSKLAPIKKPTIPRLELMAAQIGAQLLKFVIRNLDGQYNDIVLWSDSKAVLYWYAGTKQQSVFVENRLKVIREGPQSHARYVPTAENPADVLSRGCSTKELQNHNLWWYGPQWIKDKKSWPAKLVVKAPPEEDGAILPCIGSPGGSPQPGWRSAREKWEVLASPCMIASTQPMGGKRCPSPRRVPTTKLEEGQGALESHLTQEVRPFELDPNNYSSMERLIRVTALCQKAVQIFKSLSARSIPPVEAQRRRPKPRISSMRGKKAPAGHILPIPSVGPECGHAKLAAPLSARVVFGAEGGAREAPPAQEPGPQDAQQEAEAQPGPRGQGSSDAARGFRNSHLPASAHSPVLLHKKDRFTRLLVESIHKKTHHSGPCHTLAQVRLQYWIPAGRVLARTVCRACVRCLRWGGGAFQAPREPPLPSGRVQFKRPFETTGVDFLGPLLIQEETGGPLIKRWVSLFTCAATRAVHLEVAQDCSAEEFLNCFRIFVATRGAPKQMISDNARNFEVTSKLLKKPMMVFNAENGVNWRFITECSPWMGGFWERMVQSVKKALKKSMDRAVVSTRALQVVLKEVEATLNRRPLTRHPHWGRLEQGAGAFCILVSSQLPVWRRDTADPLELRERRGIQSTGCLAPESPVQNSSEKPGRSTMESPSSSTRHGCTNTCPHCWRGMYSNSPRASQQGHPYVDQPVLIEDQGPRGSWKLGRITELIKSQDGLVRNVMVQPAKGRPMKRAIALLHPWRWRWRRSWRVRDRGPGGGPGQPVPGVPSSTSPLRVRPGEGAWPASPAPALRPPSLQTSESRE